MYTNEIGIMEINAYYDRKGGIRTANVSNYANSASFAQLMQRAVARAAAETAAQNRQADDSGSTVQTGKAAQGSIGGHAATASGSALAGAHSAAVGRSTGRQTASAGNGAAVLTPAAIGRASSRNAAAVDTSAAAGRASSPSDDTQAAQDGSNICCEECHQTSQLMLQMMTRNLYAQSALGYPLTGAGAWTAYQSMANMLGSGLFS